MVTISQWTYFRLHLIWSVQFRTKQCRPQFRCLVYIDLKYLCYQIISFKVIIIMTKLHATQQICFLVKLNTSHQVESFSKSLLVFIIAEIGQNIVKLNVKPESEAGKLVLEIERVRSISCQE